MDEEERLYKKGIKMEQLKEILEKHKLWLENKEGGEIANFIDANLLGANLWGADLKCANLVDANLKDANLVRANLKDANLYNANLKGANLWNCIGNGKEIRTIQTEYYTVNLTKDFIQIGCEQYTAEQWKSFSDKEISDMAGNALKFWNKYKDFIFTAHELAFREQGK